MQSVTFHSFMADTFWKTYMLIGHVVVTNQHWPCFHCRALIAGGGAPEIELALRLAEYSQTCAGMEQYCFRQFSEALEVIPFTLAENAGLNPISTVTELRNKHAQGEKMAGINVRKVSG